MQLFSFGRPEDPLRELREQGTVLCPENRCSRGVKKNGTGVLSGTSNGQKTKDKEKKIQKINTIYRTVMQETQ